MFKLFKGMTKAPAEPLAPLDDAEFVRAVRDLIIHQEPGGWVMIAVGISCKIEYVAAFRKVCERKGVKIEDVKSAPDLPALIDEYWKESNNSRNSSTTRLRSEWLYMGALACYASERANDDDASQRYLLEIWLTLLRGCLIAPKVLKKNILWNEEEKDDLLMEAPRGALVARMFKFKSFFPKQFRFDHRVDELIEEQE